MFDKVTKIIRLVEPALCVNCRFGSTVMAKCVGGEFERVIRCKRLDCDNWERNSALDFSPLQDIKEDNA